MACKKIIWLIALLEALSAFRGINGSDVLPLSPPSMQLEGSKSNIKVNQINNEEYYYQIHRRTSSSRGTKRRASKRVNDDFQTKMEASYKLLHNLSSRLDELEEESWTLGDDVQEREERMKHLKGYMVENFAYNESRISSLCDQMNDFRSQHERANSAPSVVYSPLTPPGVNHSHQSPRRFSYPEISELGQIQGIGLMPASSAETPPLFSSFFRIGRQLFYAEEKTTKAAFFTLEVIILGAACFLFAGLISLEKMYGCKPVKDTRGHFLLSLPKNIPPKYIYATTS